MLTFLTITESLKANESEAVMSQVTKPGIFKEAVRWETWYKLLHIFENTNSGFSNSKF